VIVTLNKSLKSTAAGRYQFLNSTWVGLEMPDFKPDSQDKAAIKLFKRRRMQNPLFVGDVEQAIRLGNKEWAALPWDKFDREKPLAELDISTIKKGTIRMNWFGLRRWDIPSKRYSLGDGYAGTYTQANR
jgi:muramidase (phage lysozyme)